MLLPLAQAPAPEALASWLEVFAYICGIIAGAAIAYRQLAGKGGRQEIINSPLEVRASSGAASQQDVKEVHGRISRERQELDGSIKHLSNRVEKIEDNQDRSIDSLRLEMKEDIKGVHERINDVLKAVSKIEGKVNG